MRDVLYVFTSYWKTDENQFKTMKQGSKCENDLIKITDLGFVLVIANQPNNNPFPFTVFNSPSTGAGKKLDYHFKVHCFL